MKHASLIFALLLLTTVPAWAVSYTMKPESPEKSYMMEYANMAQKKTILGTGEFIKHTRRKRISGTFKLVKLEDGKQILMINKDFSVSRGPDLQVFLSPMSTHTATHHNATKGAVNLGLLKKFSGEQYYIIPKSVDLSNTKSVLIHCVQFSHLFGGGNVVRPSKKG